MDATTLHVTSNDLLMDTLLTPEALKLLVEVGGAPVALVLALKFLFNGKIDSMENTVKEGFEKIHRDMKEMNKSAQETKERVIRLEEREELRKLITNARTEREG